MHMVNHAGVQIDIDKIHMLNHLKLQSDMHQLSTISFHDHNTCPEIVFIGLQTLHDT
jgi:hypothetical protein